MEKTQMVKTVDIMGYGVAEFSDDTTKEQMDWDIENDILPNAGEPDPRMVALRPDLFPDIDRGSFTGGVGEAWEGIKRIPSVIGAAVFEDQESLDENAQMRAEAAERGKYGVGLDELTDQWNQGDYGGALWKGITDWVPKLAGESPWHNPRHTWPGAEDSL